MSAKNDTVECCRSSQIKDQDRAAHVPADFVEIVDMIECAKRQFQRDHGRDPTPAEVGEEVHMSVERIREVQGAAQDPMSLEDPETLDSLIADGQGSQLDDLMVDGEVPAPHDEACHVTLRNGMERAFAVLSESEWLVIATLLGFRDGRTRTCEEVSREFDMTREQIRAIEGKCLATQRWQGRESSIGRFLAKHC